MKQIFLFLLLPFILPAQESAKSVTYRIESISPDSFYLRINTVYLNDFRPDTSVSYELFRDTSELKRYVQKLKRQVKQKKNEWQFARLEHDSLSARADRLESLCESTFGITIGAKRAEIAPPDTAEPTTGFWVIYPGKGKVNAEYFADLTKIKKKCLILNQNGTAMEFSPPKKKKK